jgi:glycosyltransferase involved in cell wall biosynthesis
MKMQKSNPTSSKSKDPSAIYDVSFFDTYFKIGLEDYSKIADALHEELSFGSVADVGCGPGLIIQRLKDLGHNVRGFEGSSHAIQRKRADVPIEKVDLTAWTPSDGSLRDLVICSEVAEHLDAEHADKLVDTCCALARSRVFLTAARPGQGGHDHVNEQPPEYWIAKFASRGFRYNPWKTDSVRAKLSARCATLRWFPDNALVFDRVLQTGRPKPPFYEGEDVAVVIPCFGQAEFLKDAVNSVRAQTHPPTELVVVVGDNESWEAATKILPRYLKGYTVADHAVGGQEWRIKCRLLRDGAKGLANARNVGIKASVSPLLFCLDADDTIDPTCLEKMVARVADDRTIVASHMREFGASDGGLRVTQDMLVRGYTSPMCLFSRKLWELTGGYDIASPIEDWAFWLDCHQHNPTLCLVDEVLVHRRMHAKQSTKVDPYFLFMSVDRWLRPRTFTRTPEDEKNIATREIQAWVRKRLQHFPKDTRLQSLVRNGSLVDPRVAVVGLCMIVRNESAVIARCLASVKPLLSYWTIVDTGSTDDTKEIIQRELAGIPGQLHERPWVDFATNRNEALKLAAGKTSHVLVIDADDVLVVADGFVFPPLTENAYQIAVQHGEKRHHRPHVFKPELCRYVGKLHEYLDGPVGNVRLPGLTVSIVGGGARSQSKYKFVRDAKVLQKALEEDPTSTRNTFYLGRSWLDAHGGSGNVEHLRKAWRAFARRATMGGFQEEVFQSLLEIARARAALGHPKAKVVRAFLAAYTYRPFRAEPLFWLARFLRMVHGEHALACVYARHASTLPLPVAEVLWIENVIYEWWALDEFAVAASWIPALHEEVRMACETLLRCAPEGQHERIRGMLRLCGGA